MRTRDKQIVDTLEQFRCMSRDQVASLFFGNLKNPNTNANYVLKRLRDRGYVKANINRHPFIYFPSASSMKTDSQKVDHFLGINDCYIALKNTGHLSEFIMEPKYGKGNPEPDAMFIFRGFPFFLELQNSVYSDKVMRAKIERYKSYVNSDQWHNEHWQNGKEIVFPYVLIVSNKRYNIEVDEFPLLQVRNIDEFLSLY
jgi:hypothetical protein